MFECHVNVEFKCKSTSSFPLVKPLHQIVSERFRNFISFSLSIFFSSILIVSHAVLCIPLPPVDTPQCVYVQTCLVCSVLREHASIPSPSLGAQRPPRMPGVAPPVTPCSLELPLPRLSIIYTGFRCGLKTHACSADIYSTITQA